MQKFGEIFLAVVVGSMFVMVMAIIFDMATL